MNASKLSAFVYNTLFRKTTSFVMVIGVTALFADRLVDVVAEGTFAKINEGRLWKDVKKQLNLEGPK